jgi:hypothetical protein
VASRLEFHLLNRPLCQLHSRLVSRLRNLVHNPRSRRQLRHRVSLPLLHQANQVRNLVASLLHSRRYHQLHSRLVSLLDNPHVNLQVNLHRLQDSQVVNRQGSQLRNRLHRIRLVSLLQFPLLSRVVRLQASLLWSRIVHLVLSLQSSQPLFQLDNLHRSHQVNLLRNLADAQLDSPLFDQH